MLRNIIITLHKFVDWFESVSQISNGVHWPLDYLLVHSGQNTYNDEQKRPFQVGEFECMKFWTSE